MGRWVFQPDKHDDRSPTERTAQEIGKSMSGIWDFLDFTTETQKDFADDFLPTLDFATQIQPNGYIKYKYFSKPMASNLVLSFGTSLSKSCIFSSLRQDLVRRLLNTDFSMGIQTRVYIVNQYTQQMIKSVLLNLLSFRVYLNTYTWCGEIALNLGTNFLVHYTDPGITKCMRGAYRSIPHKQLGILVIEQQERI